tara:strand:+ start:308 stop:490 length:183 start_codon:yes stop_codon:yes gene_type:complete
MSKAYSVVWEINLDANSYREAAELALEIQRDKDSTALFFEVTKDATGVEWSIDLLEDNDE